MDIERLVLDFHGIQPKTKEWEFPKEDRPKSSDRPHRPSIFDHHACHKKFTRGYNLRSHVRTHENQRPFSCSICGAKFARQHDRKRHEALYSGEKRFVCKGKLKSRSGEEWGCGRRFERADALGFHFRSEAGRRCIQPVVDEEAVIERDMQPDQTPLPIPRAEQSSNDQKNAQSSSTQAIASLSG
ncbi:MAG: hypothetical protein Q9164_007409, partial [Protoblastenia rupestris]